jgi:hypothetical protein
MENVHETARKAGVRITVPAVRTGPGAVPAARRTDSTAAGSSLAQTSCSAASAIPASRAHAESRVAETTRSGRSARLMPGNTAALPATASGRLVEPTSTTLEAGAARPASSAGRRPAGPAYRRPSSSPSGSAA